MGAMTRLIIVKAAFDAEARVWFVESSDLAGLNVEAPTIELLTSKISDAAADLLDACDEDAGGFDIPIEIVAHASARARSRARIA